MGDEASAEERRAALNGYRLDDGTKAVLRAAGGWERWRSSPRRRAGRCAAFFIDHT